MPRDDLQWLQFKDFSTGIVQRTGIVGTLNNSPAPAVAASPTNTYRCICLPGGGLGPLPKRTFDYAITSLSNSNIPATATIEGLLIAGPVVKSPSGGSFPPFPTRAWEAHLLYEYTSAGTQVHKWVKFPFYSGDNAVALMTRSQAANNRNGPGYLSLLRMFPADPNTTGYPVVVGTWSSPNDPTVANTDYASVYPDPTNGTTIQTDALYDLGVQFYGPGLVHQSRYVALKRAVDLHGANSGEFPNNERVNFTIPNSYNQDGATPSIFGTDHPSGYGAWGSMSYSDLLLIKHSGGAELVQGDLTSPVVRHMPAVRSTAGIECIGGSTQLGFAYLVNNDGVYVWGGGAVSQCISPQLEDNFWDAGPSLTLFRGQVFEWGDWILTPNNFLFDERSKSWWRLDDIGSFQFYLYQRDPVLNKLYAAPPSMNPGGSFMSEYDKSQPATSYSWQSQPFMINPIQFSDIRSVALRATGVGTVTVTVTAVQAGGNATSQALVFNINSSTPFDQVYNVGVNGQSLQGVEYVVRIESAGTIAPIVYEVNLGYLLKQSLPSS